MRAKRQPIIAGKKLAQKSLAIAIRHKEPMHIIEAIKEVANNQRRDHKLVNRLRQRSNIESLEPTGTRGFTGDTVGVKHNAKDHTIPRSKTLKELGL